MSSLLHGMLEWLAAVTGSYGWAILLLTVGVRLALLPLQIWQNRAQAGAAAVQAETQAIQSKYQGEELQKRLQEVYARSGSKLMAGCLPMLVQWPLLLTVYSAVSRLSFMMPAGFFWIQNLGVPDPYYLLPVLVVLTSVWQSWATVPREQRGLMLVLPVVMGLVVVKASAAVALYWLATNVLALVQYYLSPRRLAASPS